MHVVADSIFVSLCYQCYRTRLSQSIECKDEELKGLHRAVLLKSCQTKNQIPENLNLLTGK